MDLDRRELLIGLGSSALALGLPWDRAKAATVMELFAAEPALVNAPHLRLGSTPLFWLPEDEAAAVQMARFLLNHGADASARNREGRTAVEQARLRGRDELARVLER